MSDSRIAVFAAERGYRAAIAELPARTRHAHSADNARIVVVDDGVPPSTRSAAPRAEAVILRSAETEGIEGGAGRSVIVQRRWLRPDVLEDVLAGRRGSPHTAIVVECVAAATELPAMLVDAIGWVRALAASDIRLDESHATAGAGLASLRAADDSPVSIGWVAQRGAADGGMLRITVLGVVRSEIGVDLAASRITVDTLTREGRLRAPERFERAERVALRRAVDAVESGVPRDELDALRADATLAGALLAGRAVDART